MSARSGAPSQRQRAAAKAPAPVRWTALGPNGGTVLSLVVAPGVSPAVYAATASGVDESVDGGSTWRHLDGGALTLDPIHAGALYAGTASGLFRIDVGTP